MNALTALECPAFDAYAAIEAVNFSTLKAAARSPLHYRHRLEHPLEETAAMRLGRAIHTAVLEPDRFPLEYVLYKGGDRRGKEWSEFAALHAAETILKADEYERCLAIRDAVRSHAVARKLLRSGRPEVTLTWTDEESGLDCKARPDWLSSRYGIDLKSTADVEARIFCALSARMLYNVQLGFYAIGARANRLKLKDWKIIAVEQDPPHDVAVYTLPDEVLYAGEEQARELLRLVAECRRTRKWPGRYPEEQALHLPGWALPDEDATEGLQIPPAGASAYSLAQTRR